MDLPFRGKRCRWVWVLLLVAGCRSSGPSAVSYSVARFEGGALDHLLDFAEVSLLEDGFTIGERDEGKGLLITRPKPVDRPGAPAVGRATLSSRGEQRRVAEIWLQRTNTSAAVYCRVVVEEQTTQAHRLFVNRQDATDRPVYTAIDQDAATSRSQNTVWETVSRDRGAERRLLSAIQSRVSSAPEDRSS